MIPATVAVSIGEITKFIGLSHYKIAKIYIRFFMIVIRRALVV